MSSQHVAILGSDPTILPASTRPPPGPILILPESAQDCTFSRNKVAEQLLLANPSASVLLGASSEAKGLIWMPKATLGDVSRKLEDLLQAHPGIRWIQLPMAGVDFYAALMAKEGMRERLWTSGKPVAEHALALTLSLLRRLPQRANAMQWGRNAGRSLFGLNLLLVGMGGISHALLSLLQPFKCNVTVLRRNVPSDADVRTLTTSELGAELPNADVIILATALTKETHHLISKTELKAMKPNAILVNIGRGELINTQSLCDAIESNAIAGVGLDVTDPEPLPPTHKLWSLMNRSAQPEHEGTQVIITPHTADTLEMVEPLLKERIRVNALAFFRQDGKFVGVVDTKKGY